jgi:hypothetical protein
LPALFLVFSACSDSDTEDTGNVPPDAGAQADAAEDDVAVPEDSGVDAGVEEDGGIVLPPSICEEIGLARQELKASDPTYRFGDIAGDFVTTELDNESYSLAEKWTGCESFTFLNYIPTSGNFEDLLFDSDVDELIFNTPLNAQFFFLSQEGTEELRRNRVGDVRTRIEEILTAGVLSEDELRWQRARFHYVVDNAADIFGSVGEFLDDYRSYSNDPSSVVDLGDRGRAPAPPPFSFAIDRDQRWDPGESLYRYVGGPPAFAMAQYLPLFFDHKARLRDAQQLEENVTKIELANTTTTARILTTTANLPSAAEMAGFDTMEFDVRIVCHERNVFACSEWDRIANIKLCSDPSCTTQSELVRWITPYWRRGEQRWVIGASALLGMVKNGGAQTIRMELGPEWERPTPWEVQIYLRLANKNVGSHSVEAVRAFTGGVFDATYNTRKPVLFTPPASATKVELVVILSGHGQVNGNNCAEWCDHRHQFTINGRDLTEIRHQGTPGSDDGCGPAAALGAPPGQWGNWAPERAYWCPGLPVEHMRIDLTADVTLGAENTLTYSGNYAGRAPAGGDIALESYIVYSE